MVVIETDGTIEQADSIKVAYDGAPATGLDIFRHPLDAAAAHPAIRARQQGIAGLRDTCRQCPVVTSCGGGLYAHRYRTGTGFDNPSVYCADLEKIITHVRAGLRPAAAVGRQGTRIPARRPLRRAGRRVRRTPRDRASGRGQRSVRRALLRLVHDRARGRGNDTFTAGWDLLVPPGQVSADGASTRRSRTRTCAPGPSAACVLRPRRCR